jgi:hypothetical protein
MMLDRMVLLLCLHRTVTAPGALVTRRLRLMQTSREAYYDTLMNNCAPSKSLYSRNA